MPDVITDEQAAEMREQLAAYDRQKAYEAGLARHQVYLAVKPITESEAFTALQAEIAQFRATGPQDDSFFGIAVEAIHQGMASLGILVANWIEPAAPAATQPPMEEAGV